MDKGRLEAFSDAVIAIIITIMVLELHVPQKPTLASLFSEWQVFFSYILSFVYVGIYWNNHHHLANQIKSSQGNLLWSNLHLLFWISLMPFATSWVGKDMFKPIPTAFYGFILLGCALSYFIFQSLIIKQNGKHSKLALEIGRDFRGKSSIILYSLGILLAFISPILSYICYLIVAMLYFIPDKRIERII